MDDDQFELRSIKNALLGITRKHNPQKRFGVVNDMMMSFNTGGIIATNLVAGGQSAQESFQAVIDFLAEDHPKLSNSIALDRGYSCFKNVNAASDIGLRQNGCITKNLSPFKEVCDIQIPASYIYTDTCIPASAFRDNY